MPRLKLFGGKVLVEGSSFDSRRMKAESGRAEAGSAEFFTRKISVRYPYLRGRQIYLLFVTDPTSSATIQNLLKIMVPFYQKLSRHMKMAIDQDLLAMVAAVFR